MAEHRIRKVKLNNLQEGEGEKNYLLGERVRITAMAHLPRGHREVDLPLRAGPTEDAQLIDVHRGSKGGGDPRLALIAGQNGRAPDTYSLQWFRHT